MPKKILDVGNCAPDHQAIKQFLTRHYDCQVDQTHQASDTLIRLHEQDYSLVLVNRKLDCDYSDGIEVIHKIKGEPELSGIPVMLITNYAEHQAAAVAAGALPGFGKLELDHPETLNRLQGLLS